MTTSHEQWTDAAPSAFRDRRPGVGSALPRLKLPAQPFRLGAAISQLEDEPITAREPRRRATFESPWMAAPVDGNLDPRPVLPPAPAPEVLPLAHPAAPVPELAIPVAEQSVIEPAPVKVPSALELTATAPVRDPLSDVFRTADGVQRPACIDPELWFGTPDQSTAVQRSAFPGLTPVPTDTTIASPAVIVTTLDRLSDTHTVSFDPGPAAAASQAVPQYPLVAPPLRPAPQPESGFDMQRAIWLVVAPLLAGGGIAYGIWSFVR